MGGGGGFGVQWFRVFSVSLSEVLARFYFGHSLANKAEQVWRVDGFSDCVEKKFSV